MLHVHRLSSDHVHVCLDLILFVVGRVQLDFQLGIILFEFVQETSQPVPLIFGSLELGLESCNFLVETEDFKL